MQTPPPTVPSSVVFADSYALVEIVKGNPSYRPYFHKGLITTQMQVIELYRSVLRDYGQEKADYYLDFFSKLCVPVTLSCIPFAMLFKAHFKEEKLSYVDCVGYSRSFELEIPFLTGDKQFRFKPNVLFVK